jgi:flagellar assembly factor FliW
MTATQSSPPRVADAVDSAIHFSDGLIGCGTWKTFVLVSETDENLPVAVLKCLDEPGVQLMVTDPALVRPGYTAALSADDRKALGLTSDQRPVLFCTLTITQDGAITANLLGPLAINAQTRQGKQLVLSETTYSARHPVGLIQA